MDWNNDGMLDIIVGDRNGYVNYFRRTSDSPITLTQMPKINCAGVIINVGSNSAPVVVDWNEDGHPDMLLGNESPGNVRLYINDGSDSAPVFSTYSLVQNGSTAVAHYRNCPQVYDMNGDGKKDLLCGANDNNVYYYENIGTNDAPVFNGYASIATKYSGMRLWIDDWNEDGLPDMLTSDFNGFVWMWIQNATGTGGTSGAVPVRSLQTGENPFRGSVVITGTGFDSASIQIFDISGRTVLSGPFNGSLVWNASDVPQGAYMVRVTDAMGSSTLRMVKL
ncbi:MAG: T9SS type A sorting domain-containing protein [Candidatus Fermentibacteraceae bacterium]